MERALIIYRSILLIAFAISVFSAYLFIYRDPCQKSYSYALGVVADDLQQQTPEILNALSRAEYIWEAPLDKYSLFVYSQKDNPSLTINILSDEDHHLNTLEKGTFRRENLINGEINIYQYDDFVDLTRLVAHEYGHVLGLGHVDTFSSLMYPILVTRSKRYPELSDHDMAEFRAHCRLLQADRISLLSRISSFGNLIVNPFQ